MSLSRFIAIAAALVLIFILYVVGVFRPAIAWMETQQNTVLEFLTESRWSFASFAAGFKNRLTLAEENRRLRQERDELLAKAVGMDAIQRENSFLRKQLAYEPPQGFNKIMGAVIGRPLGDPTLLLINRGSADGLRRGDSVLNQEGLLMGTIATIGVRTAGVLPLTAVGSRIGIRLIMTGGRTAIAEGSHGLGMRAVFLPYTLKIPSGVLVATAGLEAGMPADLPVGKIGVVTPTPGQLFQEANIIDFAVPEETREIIIISRPSEE